MKNNSKNEEKIAIMEDLLKISRHDPEFWIRIEKMREEIIQYAKSMGFDVDKSLSNIPKYN